ncbi:MAG: ShlB/FhaC/HecB family hemolysin secretion/activation protein [Methylophilaceae bacterium]|nr:MAG: ShlB/FhaC/HecB family hemolysin secretion/activation protein [Methylophilaceae bacterium]
MLMHIKLLVLKPINLAMLMVFIPALATAAGSPDAGAILQQLKQPKQSEPAIAPGLVVKEVEPETGPKTNDSNNFLLNGFVIAGNKNISTQALQALFNDSLGKKVTLENLQKLVAKITDYYHAHAYPLARAVIPAQSIDRGLVNVDIYEAYYGKVSVNNHSLVKDSLLDGTLSALKTGQVIEQGKLDRSLLLLSDTPGAIVNATLKPGEIVGTSDLIVSALPSERVYGNLALDNYGNSYTGRPRIGGSVNVIDPFHWGLGDIFSFNGLTSGGGLNYGRVAYEALVNQYGTRMGGSFSALHYSLGGKFANSNAQGNAQVSSLWTKHPIIRSRDLNLYGQVKVEHMQLNDHSDAGKTDRHITDAAFDLLGEAHDKIFGGGVNAWDVAVMAGSVTFDDFAAKLSDAASAKTLGGFARLNLNLSRLQTLSTNNALYVSLAAQVAGKNLDTSQKMTLGGNYTVRAYDTSSVSGDSGYLLSAELRHDLGDVANGRLHALAFVDSAQMKINKNTWGESENSVMLSGVGVGLNWVGKNNVYANTYIATSIGAKPSQVSGDSTRVWFEIGRRF